MKRKTFIKTGLMAGSAMLGTRVLAANPTGEIFDMEEIRELVGAAHKDFDLVKKIIEAKPLLLNCANQVRKGDFETAIGGASHMGRRDIADYLVAKGARMDIFNYAFLGYDEFVMKLVTDHPHLLHASGPHGFNLLHHAKVGERTELAGWLEEKGLKETFFAGIFG